MLLFCLCYQFVVWFQRQIVLNKLLPSHIKIRIAVDAEQVSSNGPAVVSGLEPGLLMCPRPREELRPKMREGLRCLHRNVLSCWFIYPRFVYRLEKFHVDSHLHPFFKLISVKMWHCKSFHIYQTNNFLSCWTMYPESCRHWTLDWCERLLLFWRPCDSDSAPVHTGHLITSTTFTAQMCVV